MTGHVKRAKERGAEGLRFDIVAGLTAAAVVLPKAMAYATVAGLPVAVGLYTAFVPGVIYGLLGSSRVLSVSSTTTLAILTGTQLGRRGAGRRPRQAGRRDGDADGARRRPARRWHGCCASASSPTSSRRRCSPASRPASGSSSCSTRLPSCSASTSRSSGFFADLVEPRAARPGDLAGDAGRRRRHAGRAGRHGTAASRIRRHRWSSSPAPSPHRGFWAWRAGRRRPSGTIPQRPARR